MLKRIAIMTALAVSIVSANPFHGRSDRKTYTFTLSSPARVGDVQLKPGEYTVKVDGSQIALTDHMRRRIETPATLEAGDRKFTETSLIMSTDNGEQRIVLIQLGNTTNKIVFQ